MHTPITYWGDESFRAMLTESGCIYYVEEVRAFILGTILSTDSLTSNEAMAFLFKDDEGEDLEFSSQDQYEELSSQFFALWNQIAATINQEECPRLSIYPLYFESDEDRLSAAAVRANELKLFLTALNEGLDLDEIEDEKVQNLLYYFEALADSLHEAVIRLTERYDTEDSDLIDSMLEDSENAWYGNFMKVKTYLLSLKKLQLNKTKNNLIYADFVNKTVTP